MFCSMLILNGILFFCGAREQSLKCQVLPCYTVSVTARGPGNGGGAHLSRAGWRESLYRLRHFFAAEGFKQLWNEFLQSQHHQHKTGVKLTGRIIAAILLGLGL